MLKQSDTQYRNIKGVYYVCTTSNPDSFKECKAACKRDGFKYRIIDNQFYQEVKVKNEMPLYKRNTNV